MYSLDLLNPFLISLGTLTLKPNLIENVASFPYVLSSGRSFYSVKEKNTYLFVLEMPLLVRGSVSTRQKKH